MDLKVKSFESRIQTLKEEVAELEVNSKDDMAAFLKKQESVRPLHSLAFILLHSIVGRCHYRRPEEEE